MTLQADVHITAGRFELDVALAVEPGRTVAVIGPNGAGKTTLLRALAGLAPLDAGRVALDGRVLDEPASGVFVAPEHRPVSVVFHDQLLFPHLNAVDNVAFGLRARGVRRARARAVAREWLGRVQLGGREAAFPAELSGGQAQRVALARALAVEPSLLLLDEPLAALDARVRTDVRRELRAHLAEFSGVRIIVTHDPVDAAALADDVVVLEHGRITQRGTPPEIAARPRSAWVAHLVGTNLLRGTARGGSIELDGGGALAAADRPEGNGRVVAVVAPRAIALHRERPAGTPRNVWGVVVRNLEAGIDDVRVQLDGPPDLVAAVTPQAVRELEIRPGSRLWAAVKATEIDVFDD